MNTEKPRSSFSLKAFRAMAFLFLPLYLAGGGFAQEKENGQPAQNDSADALAKPDEPKTESELAPNEPVVEANAQPTPNRSSEWNRGRPQALLPSYDKPKNLFLALITWPSVPTCTLPKTSTSMVFPREAERSKRKPESESDSNWAAISTIGKCFCRSGTTVPLWAT